MPTTLTLKNIPDAVYARLRAQAALNRRSLNNEAIVCLENVLNLRPTDPAQRSASLRALRASLGPLNCDAPTIDALKRQGRE